MSATKTRSKSRDLSKAVVGAAAASDGHASTPKQLAESEDRAASRRSLNALVSDMVRQGMDDPEEILAKIKSDHEEELAGIVQALLLRGVESYLRTFSRTSERRFFVDPDADGDGRDTTDPIGADIRYLPMLAQTRARINRTTFVLPGGERVSWAEATVAQHEQRIGMLQENVKGLAKTVSIHREVVAAIKRSGVACLADVPDEELPLGLRTAA